MNFAIIGGIAFPLFLAIGGILAWRVSRKEGSFDAPERQSWRDDSLDDWRRERDAQLEEERRQRVEEQAEGLRTGKEEAQETQRQQHTRLGG